MPEGPHEITHTLTDPAGNESAPSGPIIITVDTTPPAKPATPESYVDDVGPDTSPNATAPSTDDSTPGVNIGPGLTDKPTLYVDGVELAATYDPETGALTPDAPLTDGQHDITHTLTDPAGNESAPSDPIVITVDTSAVAVSIVRAVDDVGTVTGNIGDGGVSDDATPTLVGIATAGATVRVSLGGVEIGETTPDGTGSWSLTLPEQAEGTHVYEASAENAAGATGTATFTLTIDLSAPAVPSIGAVHDDMGERQGALASGDVTDDTTPTLSGSGAAAGDVITIYDRGAPIGVTTVAGDGTWSFTPVATLADGEHILTVTARDPAGNESAASEPFALTVDLSAPTATAVIAALTTDTGADGDFITSDQMLLVEARVSGATGAGERVQIDLGDGVGWREAEDRGDGVWRLDARELTLAEGDYSFAARVIDAAGASGPVSTQQVVIDVTGPTEANALAITGFADDVGALTGDFASGAHTDDAAPLLKGTVSGLQDGDVVQVYEGAALPGAGALLGVATVSGGAWTLQLDALSEGEHVFTAVITDCAGNRGTTSNIFTLTVDVTPPETPAAPESYVDDVGPETSASSTAPITDDATPGVNIGPGLTDTPQLYVDGVKVAASYDPQTGALTPDAPLPDGTHDITYTLTDAVGNESAPSGPISITVDTTPPTQTVRITALIDEVAPVEGEVPSGGTTNDPEPELRGTVSASISVDDMLLIYRDGQLVGEATVTGTEWTFTDTTGLSDGATYVYTAQIVDGAGNVGEMSRGYTVSFDDRAPGSITTITAVQDNFEPQQGVVANGGVTNDVTPRVDGTLSAPLAAGEVVAVYRNGVKLGVAVVTGDSWRFQDTGLIDGQSFSYTARIEDKAGNAGAWSGAYVIHIDQDAPTVTASISAITLDTGDSKDFITSDQTLLVEARVSTAPGADERVQINLGDGDGWRDAVDRGDGLWRLDAEDITLPEGVHTFDARVVDAAGNAGPVTMQKVTIDITPPLEGYAVAITAFADNVGAVIGDFPSGASTDDAAPLLRGTVTGMQPGDSIRVYSGAQLMGLATLAGDTWTLQLNDLDEGMHAFVAVVTDVAGNRGATSDAFTLTVDTAPPTAIATISAIADDTGASNADFITADETLTVGGTVTGVLGPDEKVQIDLGDGEGWRDAADLGGGLWSLDAGDSPLAEGDHIFQARVIDEAGNAGAVTTQQVTIDTTAPMASSVITAVSDDTGNPMDFITADRTPVIHGKLTGMLGDGEVAEISLDDGGAWTRLTIAGDGGFSHPAGQPLDDGAYVCVVRVVDVAGNVGASHSKTVTIAADPPTAQISIASISYDTGVAGDFITSDTKPTVHGNVTGAIGPIERARITFDGGASWRSLTVQPDGSWSHSGNNALADGAHQVRVEIVNIAAVVGSSDSRTITVLSTPPSFSDFHLDLAASSDNGLSPSDNVTSVVTPQITGIVRGLADHDVAGVASGATTVTLFHDANGDGALDADERVFADGLRLTPSGADWTLDTRLPSTVNGAYKLTAVLQDVAGNLSAPGLLDGSAAAELVIDTDGTPSVASGAQTADGLGYALASAGDFNGDGYEDFIVSAPHGRFGAVAAGLSDMYLLYGGVDGLPSLASAGGVDVLTPEQGFRITSTSWTGFGGDAGIQGLVVTGLGDINGDGYDDVVVSSNVNDRAYVLFGRAGGVNGPLALSNLENGATSDGFVIKRSNTSTWAPTSVAGGDINGDGYADIIISDQNYQLSNNGGGAYWVLLGHAGAAGGAQWGNLALTIDGLRHLTGAATVGALLDDSYLVYSNTTGQISDSDADLGQTVQVIGDVNGDGFRDYVVTAPRAYVAGAVGAGEAYLIFGGPQGLPVAGASPQFDLKNLDPSEGVRLLGSASFEALGGTNVNASNTVYGVWFGNNQTVANIADINGDGIEDFAIGSPNWGRVNGLADTGMGRVYVLYGKNGATPWADVELGKLTAADGFILSSSSNVAANKGLLGGAVSGAGDVNADGNDDFIVTAPGWENQRGATFLVYGQAGGGFAASTDLDVLLANGGAVKLPGGPPASWTGTSAAGGDWDSNGVSDVAFGAYNGGVSGAGSYYVYNGSIAGLTQTYTTGDDVLQAGETSPGAAGLIGGVDSISGGQGNDVILGLGDAADSGDGGVFDVGYGGAGDDLISIVGLKFTRIDGGSGLNTLRIDGAEPLTLELGSLGAKVQNFGVIDLEGAASDENGSHTVVLGLADVLRLTENQSGAQTQPLTILGDSNDTLDIDLTKYQITGSQSVSGGQFDSYHHADLAAGNTQGDIWVQQGMTVV